MNINEYVTVKLTEYCLNVFKKSDSLHAYELKENKLDIQMWALMNIFGSEMMTHNQICFENNEIII